MVNLSARERRNFEALGDRGRLVSACAIVAEVFEIDASVLEDWSKPISRAGQPARDAVAYVLWKADVSQSRLAGLLGRTERGIKYITQRVRERQKKDDEFDLMVRQSRRDYAALMTGSTASAGGVDA